MEIVKDKNKIIILNPTDFNVVQTLECGQIFRFQIKGNEAKVYSQNKMASNMYFFIVRFFYFAGNNLSKA